MVIDLHGYHPRDLGCDFGVDDGPFQKLVRQAWEMGEPPLTLIHGHGRGRGISPGFVNTNTGYFGLCIRRELRHHKFLRQWIMHTTLDCFDPGSTSVKLKPNPAPSRTEIDCLPVRSAGNWRRPYR